MGGPESEVVFRGTVGRVVHETQPDGRIYETYERPPGVRVIVIDEMNRVLVTREHRREHGEVDVRLPGGKVFDTMDEMLGYLGDLEGKERQAKLVKAVLEAGEIETAQEAGIHVELSADEIVARTPDGTTVDYDIYYVVTREYSHHKDGQALEPGEEGIAPDWLSLDDAWSALRAREIKEMRTAGVLACIVLPMLER